ncbi:hypothetical protein RDABS01_027057 [Bienertia sinuspersici]
MEPDSVFLNAVINAYAESGNMEEAKKAFVKTRYYGYRPSTSTYNTLIKGFGIADVHQRNGETQSLRLRDALRFVYKMKEVEVLPNLAGFQDITDMDWVNKGLLSEPTKADWYWGMHQSLTGILLLRQLNLGADHLPSARSNLMGSSVCIVTLLSLVHWCS